MNRIIIASIVLVAVLIAVSPLIERGVHNFKTFLELANSFGPCDGLGSPPPCKGK